jgi:hypothetical protein
MAACLTLLLIVSCGGKHVTTITIEIVPNSAQTVDEGSVINFTALLGGDTNNDGVTWDLTASTGCAGAGCGTLTNSTKLGVTYTAPTSVSASITATLTATSVAQPKQKQTQTITVVLPPTFTTTSLPNAANAVPYNATIVVTNGVTPYTYKVIGNLPPGLNLNATSGAFTGSPSAPVAGQPPATYNFVVSVTDSGGAAAIAEPLAITVTPPPTLSVTNGALPIATTNVAYSASINTQGGVAPLTFSVVGGGGFPVPGLALNPSTGQVTGIPTVAGPYTFQVKVTDSSLPTPGQVFIANVTLPVQNPSPLLISTSSLANGATASPYTASLQASGGVPPYTWSVVQGQLPSGLTLASQTNSTGKISGTPVIAGTSTFTVQVKDSEVVPMTTTGVFSITITPGSSNNLLLQGQYAFLFRGFDNGGSVAIAGTFNVDGAGNIPSGREDSNRASGVFTGITLTGTYSLGSDGRGTMEFKAIDPRNPTVVVTTDYQLALDAEGNIRMFENNSTGANSDTFGTHGEGIVKPVSSTSDGFTATNFSGNYAFGFTGQDFSNKPQAFVGMFHSDGGQTFSAGTSDLNDAGTSSSQSLSGDFTVASGNLGGAHLVFQPPSKSQITLTFNFYFITASDLFFVEVDSAGTPFPNPPRLSGEVILQQPAALFNAASVLPSPSVATGTGTDGTKANIFAGLLPATTCNGITNFVFPYDQNDGGTITSPAPLSGTCNATPNGRVAFTWSAPATTPRFAAAYLTGPGQGFLIGSDASVSLGLLELQSGTPFTNASLQGNYALSAPFPAEPNVANLVGQLAGNGTGSLPGTIDEFTAPTVALPEGKANLAQAMATNIDTIAATGRGTLTTNSPIGVPTHSIFYMVSPTDVRWLSADTGVVDPQLIFLDR